MAGLYDVWCTLKYGETMHRLQVISRQPLAIQNGPPRSHAESAGHYCTIPARLTVGINIGDSRSLLRIFLCTASLSLPGPDCSWGNKADFRLAVYQLCVQPWQGSGRGLTFWRRLWRDCRSMSYRVIPVDWQ